MDTPQETPEKDPKQEALKKAIASLPLRGIGPALMGGRISGIVVNPNKRSTWYVAVGSGGVWKTTNAGTTWTAVFEKEVSYSIGAIALDPTNPEIVWVGTGENVSGRHVGWGDGVYRSLNGGKTWQKMGLDKSEHIGRIVIDPRDGNTVFVAAEGPLWSSGGERGVYKTTDGGQTWNNVLEIDENTGVAHVLFDPSNPDILYASAYQRRRHTWSFLSGGPNSGIYKSTDGGANWRKLSEGLPKGDMGNIGLAVSAANPDLLYATVEANEEERGFYRSLDKGESWEKRNSYISGGTGPHYYQVIEASQTNPDFVYQMDVFVHVTRDGGKTFNNMETGKEKHSDNHALWIDPDDGQHMLLGADAGLYESFDEGISWRHFPNLPVSQFYRLDVDNAQPFYNILGGAQDLGTLYGPSRTTNREGVRNQDWWVPLGADGYHVAFDPTDPEIFYLEYQVGNSFRYNMRTMELIDIKPMAAPDEPVERWNWDAPIIISPHSSERIYVTSQRVWRSDDKGNSWTAVSPDLTRNQNRYELPFIGRVWSVDDLYDAGAMSQYNTITFFSESPVVEGLFYVGTDDGLIQISEDGGQNWRQAAPLPDVPENALINAAKASHHDANTLFAIANAHQLGDFPPLIFESNDRGNSWHSIAGDLPSNSLIWAIEQDHKNPDLLFIAAEFGLFASPNKGGNWYKLNTPTISFRDLKLQRRDGDLVGASFGRGFYVLDDYAPLRDIASGALDNEGHLFPIRDAWWYVPHMVMQSPGQPTVGSSSFKSPNPPFGATFTYNLKEALLSSKKSRQETEKKLRKDNADTPFPGWDTLRIEATESEPQVLLLVRDADGNPLRWLKGKTEAGLHQVTWNLRHPAPNPIVLKKPDVVEPWATPPEGAIVTPGQYSAELWVMTSDGSRQLGEAQSFTVKPLPEMNDDAHFASTSAIQQEVAELVRQILGTGKELERTADRVKHIEAALLETPKGDPELFTQTAVIRTTLANIKLKLTNDDVRQKLNEPSKPSVAGRAMRTMWGLKGTREMATETQKQNLEIAQNDFSAVRQQLTDLIANELTALEAALEAAGAPWTPGRKLS